MNVKSEKGFSLVEAIVSVAIVGIIILPLSMMLTHTVKGTAPTKKKLIANEISQHYLENFKSKQVSDLEEIFIAGNERLITSPESNILTYLPRIEPGYKVKLTLDEDAYYSAITSPIDGHDLPAINDWVTSDITVSIDKHSSGIKLYKGSSEYTSGYADPVNNNSRVITIEGIRSTGNISVTVKDGSGNNVISMITPAVTNNIVFDVGDLPPSVNGKTSININSNMLEQLNIYVYEGTSSAVDLDFDVKSGLVSIARNLKKISTIKGNVVKVLVEVIDEKDDKVLSSVEGSITNE